MILLLWVVSFFGSSPMVQDTVVLAEVEVYAPKIERFAQGQKIQVWDKKELENYEGRALADLLKERSPVFVRQYGAGMLASPSFRGTSAGNTALFWNGLPINSPSLGQSDLSILPIQAIDQVSLQFGNAGALFGNEAIGGSLHLQNQLQFSKGFHASLSQQFGSFGAFKTGIQGSFSNEIFSSSTKVYREFAKNNFPYQDLGQIGTPEVKEDHAQFKQIGFVQDFGWNINSNSQLKAAFWLNKSNREIQPVMGSNTNDLQEDQSFRAVLDYYRFGSGSVWNLKTGLVKDQLDFNGSLSRTDQYFLATDYDQTFSEKLAIKGGIRFTQMQADLSSYSTSDQRIEIYQSTKYKPSKDITLSLNLRELVYQDQFAPFAPSIGLDWGLWNNESSSLLLQSSFGRGFKVPTLNDRFWEPGGNPNLLPEESWSGEIGFLWKVNGDSQWSNQLTYYRMSVDNWIIWLPQGSVWIPENIKHVSNQGIEYQGETSGKLGSLDWGIDWSYTWSRAVTTSGIGETDPAIGKQLPYTPQHQANAKIRVSRDGISTYLSTFFVGERSVTADNPRMMPSYQLFNFGLAYDQLKWRKLAFPVRFQINNLFNTDYQVLYLRAMPGRSFQFNLSIRI
ncbi:iron complex outermembrane receptor protein [Algoriphagus iocasae]|uniref:Iron complex outermembrane receptor protein n=1 Tax=Algoriphagus iocasae TaxID=1836499 RepID=A0A841MPU2_9BACT|nr:TonB-dependent receptor plug domain-containing protein [Algoriphagus iocasae]MBB6324648.1 iron complex outermembrane receptor protein [Algoriphagus iocasae]